MTQKTASSFMQKLPNYLTFMRILVIPGVVASFLSSPSAMRSLPLAASMRRRLLR